MEVAYMVYFFWAAKGEVEANWALEPFARPLGLGCIGL